MRIPRVLIAGASSGVGKTTLAIGVAGAMARRGLRVQPFKVGPDYIDPQFLTAVAGRPARNLDAWLVTRRTNLRLFARACRGADLAVLEGVMGLYDGRGSGEGMSTAQMARWLECPTLLVLDASASSTSLAAVALGFRRFDPRVSIAGVILNRVYGSRHEAWCRRALRRAGFRVLGAVPHEASIGLPERHLGLVPEEESRAPLASIVDHVEAHVDLDGILAIAVRAPALPGPLGPERDVKPSGSRPRLGLARDRAFNFYYEDGLAELRRWFDIVPFSPLSDHQLPGVDALYLGGGFPELFVQELSRSPARREIQQAAEDGMPLYAECGGMMYLTRSIRPMDGKPAPMVGVLDAETVMRPRLVLNYTQGQVHLDTPLLAAGSLVRGHEFHASHLESLGRDARLAYRLREGEGISDGRDGWTVHGVLASYGHLHLSRTPGAAPRFAAAALRYRNR